MKQDMVVVPQEKISQEDLIKTENKTWEQKKIKELRIKTEDGTSYNDIINYVMNEHQQAQQMSTFNYQIECFKEDGIFQLHKAITKILGVAKHKKEENPSGRSTPVNTISVTLYDGTTYKVPYGKIELPDMGPDAFTDIAYDKKNHVLHIQGQCQFRFSSLMDEIIQLTKIYLNSDSIYKNQAIELDSTFKPRIMNLSNIEKEFMVLSELTEKQLIPVKSRILEAEKCKAKNIPLKYGVLFYGPYGR